MFKKILCTVDGSAQSVKAATLAGELAAKFAAQITFLTVAKELKMTPEIKRYIEVEHLAGERQYVLDDFTEEVLEKAKQAAKKAGASGVKTEVATGHPARKIVSFAERGGYDCIVMGSRGHGDIEGFLLGSVSHKVTSLAKCTVITVK